MQQLLWQLCMPETQQQAQQLAAAAAAGKIGCGLFWLPACAKVHAL
jgi:hypothetical protein